VLDARDWGIIVYRDMGAINPRYVVESSTCKLTLSQARAIAEPLVAKYTVGGPAVSSQAHPPTKTNGLMLVHPNGMIGGLSYAKHESPARLRLAWVLYYARDEEIWIDASTGKVLGGSSKYSARPQG
jgi:hypothetical protein